MKKIVLLFCMVLSASMMYGQLKVEAAGNTIVGQSTSGVLDVMRVIGSNNSVRLIVESTFGSPNVGFQFWHGGAKKWSPAAYQGVPGGNIDFAFYNDQTATPSILIDGSTDDVTIAGELTADGMLLTSDENFKKDIKPYENSLDKVLKMNPISFQYKEGGDRTFVGIRAQELQEIDPALVQVKQVTEVGDLDKFNARSAKTTEKLVIQADAVQYMLVGAIKEQQEIISEQEARLADLEATIADLVTNSSVGSVHKGQVTLSTYDLAGLEQNRPNPFNGQTIIDYVVPSNASTAVLNIYDVNGKVMKTVDIDHTGEGQLTVNAEDIPSGTYSYQLVVDGRSVSTKKMSHLK